MSVKEESSRDPVSVDTCKCCTCVEAFFCLQRADEDAIRSKKVANGGSFCKELGVGEDVKTAVWFRVGLEDGTHRLGCAAGDCGLFDYNLGGVGHCCDTAGCEFDVTMGDFVR